MAAAKNTRARKARSVPHRVKRHRPVRPDSAAGMLSAVRLRLKPSWPRRLRSAPHCIPERRA